MAVILGTRLVRTRDGTLIPVNNLSRRNNTLYDNYTAGNAFYTIGAFDSLKFEGDMSIGEFIATYPDLTIKDFDLRKNSAYTLSGDFFNMGPSSNIRGFTKVTSNVTISTNPDIPTTINVLGSRNFYDSGWLLSSNGSIIKYDSKFTPAVGSGLQSTFTGYVVSGSSTLSIGNELIQYSPP